MANRYFSIFIKIGVFLFLMSIPFFSSVYFETVYFIFIGILAVVGFAPLLCFKSCTLEKKFCARWEKAKNKSYLFNLVIEGLRKLAIVVVMILASTLFFYGYTPIEIATKLTFLQLLLIVLLLTVGSLGLGAITCHDNDKKYNAICLRKDR